MGIVSSGPGKEKIFQGGGKNGGATKRGVLGRGVREKGRDEGETYSKVLLKRKEKD